MHVTSEVIERAVRMLQGRLPGLLAVYGFGSQVQGTAGPDSDLDLAVLVPLYGVAAVLVWRRTGWGFLLAAVAAVAGVLHQVGYVVAMPFQVAADVPGAVNQDPFEPVIVAVYLTLVVLLLRGLTRGGMRPRRDR